MKVKLSFGHKAVISSLSKLNIKSENFKKVTRLGILMSNENMALKVKI